MQGFELTALVSDGAGGVFATGQATTVSSVGGAALGGTYDMLVAHFDGAGTRTWSRRFGGGGNDRGSALTYDGADQLVVVGSTTSAGGSGGAPLGVIDGLVISLDAGGQEAWATRVGWAGETTGFSSVSLDAAGEVFCGGVGSGPFGVGILARLDPAGVATYAYRFSSISIVRDVKAIGAGQVLVTGTDTVFNSGYIGLHGPNGFSVWWEYLAPNTGQRAMGRDILAWPEAQPSGTALFAVIGDLSPVSNPTPTIVVVTETGTVLSRTSYAPGLRGEGTDFASSGTGTILALAKEYVGSLRETHLVRLATPGIGMVGCAGEINGSGLPGTLEVLGSDLASADNLTLVARDLPVNKFGYFLASRDTGLTPGAAGGLGTLCLGGEIGRFNRAGEVGFSGGEQRFHREIELASFPGPQGPQAATQGETWWFQCWYRDYVMAPTSNLTGSVGVQLR